MHSSRRGFLRLAGRACVASVLAVASGRIAYAAGPGHDAVVKPSPLSANGMPMPQKHAPSPDAELARRIKAISNVFEVGRPEPDYAYVENLGDGRGYTVTQYGFCTYNSEVAQVINRYAGHVPDTPPEALSAAAPARAMEQAGADRLSCRVAQGDQGFRSFSGSPATRRRTRSTSVRRVEAAAAVGVHSAIGKSIFYDTLSAARRQHRSGLAADDPQAHDRGERRCRQQLGSRLPAGRFSPSANRCWKSLPIGRRGKSGAPPHAASTHCCNLLDNNPDLVPPIEVANADVDVVVL